MQTETYKTLRDEFAMAVLQYMLTVDASHFEKPPTQIQVCKACYQWADLMLEAREEVK